MVLFHISVFIAGQNRTGVVFGMAHTVVVSISSHRPRAIEARVFAVSGAIQHISHHLAQEI